MAMLRQGDFAIVDRVRDSEKGVVAAGLYCIEQWRASEMFTGAGALRVQLTNDEWKDQMCEQIEGETKEAKQQAAEKCMGAIRRVLCDMVFGDEELGGWRRQGVRVGKYAVVQGVGGWRLCFINDMADDLFLVFHYSL